MTALPEIRQITLEWAQMRPFGGFDLIMIDPPWVFETRSDKGAGKSPQAQYDCQSDDWIMSLPVSALSGDNCLLWLWATPPKLPLALSCAASWGFTYKTCGWWSKKTRHGKQAFGTGYFLRNAGEPFIIATRGVVKTARSVRSTIEGQVRKHSQKPEEAYREAERILCPITYPSGARRADIFSRTDRPGWVAWGNEAGTIAAEAIL